MPDERWLTVPGHEGLYEVSDHGHVRTTRRQGSPGGLLKLNVSTTDGYLKVKLYNRDGGKTHRVHHLVCFAFLGPRPAGLEIRHLDGDKLNNAATNLAYGTHSENQRDIVRHGRHPNANQESCQAGHEYNSTNTHYDDRGRRRCRVCQRGHDRRYRQRKKAGAAA